RLWRTSSPRASRSPGTTGSSPPTTCGRWPGWRGCVSSASTPTTTPSPGASWRGCGTRRSGPPPNSCGPPRVSASPPWAARRGARGLTDMREDDFPPENIYGHTKKLRFIRRHLAESRRAAGRPLAVLDFGCGNGSAVSRFLLGDDVDYTGVDFHRPSLAHAREHFGSPRARFCDAVPRGAAFDVIVYADVLEHLDDPLSLLRAHVRQLNDGGLVIGSVPNGYGPF